MLKDFFKKTEPLETSFEASAEPAKIQSVSVNRHSERAVMDDQFYEIKNRIHAKLIEEANLSALDDMAESDIRAEISLLVEDFLDQEKVLLNVQEKQALISEVKDELIGLGPLEPLLKDPRTSDILCNTYKDVYIEQGGILRKTNSRFVNDAHLMNIIDRIISRVGRRIDESTPMVDARLPDGSRVNAIIPPLAVDGPIMSIRRFGAKMLLMDDLIGFDALTPEIAEFLAGCVKAKLNIMISGGTGAGPWVFSGFTAPSTGPMYGMSSMTPKKITKNSA